MLFTLVPRQVVGQESTLDSVIELPIRVHLLQADEGQAVSTTWTEEDVHTLLRINNQVWELAGIQWVIESIRAELSPHAERFDSLVAGQLQPTGERQRSIVNLASLLEDGWDLFVIREYGQIAGGVFWPEIPAVVLGQRGMGVDLAPDGRGGRTLAHELGHSLGLIHEECDRSVPNLMAVSCWTPDAAQVLTEEQIQRARNQARIGPIRGLSRELFP